MKVILFICFFFSALSVQAGKITPYSQEAYHKLVESKKDFVIYIYATWCPKCRKQKNYMDKYLKTKKEVSPILLADYDTEVELRKKFKIFVQGTMLNFKMGKEIEKDRLIAETNPELLKGFLDKISTN